jgi:flagellar motility protein MotE (MotC chaperone)
MKQVITWSLILVVVFVLLIGIAFGVLSYLAPAPEELAAIQEETLAAPSDTTAASEPETSESDSLRQVIDELTSDLFFSRITIDSLTEVVAQKQKELQGYIDQTSLLEGKLESLKDKKISIRELAKTYESMKVSEIKPIVEKLDDKTVIALYNNMGSRTKKNLLRALSDVRAAQITKKLAGNG